MRMFILCLMIYLTPSMILMALALWHDSPTFSLDHRPLCEGN
jgi:hypothetical protein